ncbi:MAG: acetyl-CoA carboxylase biotin carboxyl carrier protein [Ruminococcus sp.]|nr:acetyl-CoA carboxylase biotin carboxyl carrier protein [Ruminococcus sp.]
MALPIEEIERLAALIGKDKLGEIEIRNDDFKIKLSAYRDCPPPPQMPMMAPPVMAAAPVSAPAPAAPAQAAPAAEAEDGNIVTAPLVGTYYSAPSPDSEPFVKIGQQVKQGDVLMIIESMKLMNEVICETDGTVAEIYVKNGEPVEFGQKLMKIS